ncbi:hypothetical protein HN953_02075 [Candidatus Woesearchaeota archaeon]|jgi:large subunit ribosomal protein L31e|nr:hypothetical protein [Candidatus Woesearchaeota archaeon]
MERIYNIPLRKEFQKAPRYKKSGKSIRAIKEFILKHTKAKEVKIGKYLNELVWKNGPKNPPHKVNVKVTKEEDIAKVELVDAPVEEVKEEPKKTATKEEIKEEVKEEVKEELQKEGMKESVAEKVAEEVKEESGKEIVKEVTKEKPKKKKEKVPTAAELAKKK